MSKRIWALRLIFSTASLAWMAFIFQASSASPQEVDESLGFFNWLGPYRNIVGHMVLYAILASLLEISIWTWRRPLDQLVRWGIAATAIATVYGITDELHQSVIPGRSATVLDVLVDGVGALLAVAVLTWLAHLIQRRRISSSM